MGNIRQQLIDLINPRHRAVAKIVGGKGADTWVGETPTGGVVVITGQTQIGESVYFDAVTLRIEGKAPDLDWQEIKV